MCSNFAGVTRATACTRCGLRLASCGRLAVIARSLARPSSLDIRTDARYGYRRFAALLFPNMKSIESFDLHPKLILRGINLKLTGAMKAMFTEKVDRLFRHEPRIVRIRVDVEDASRGGVPRFAAKGHIEIGGPDLVASVTTEDAYHSVDLLIDRLDRMLRKRMAALTSRRTAGDIRELSAAGAV